MIGQTFLSTLYKIVVQNFSILSVLTFPMEILCFDRLAVLALKLWPNLKSLEHDGTSNIRILKNLKGSERILQNSIWTTMFEFAIASRLQRRFRFRQIARAVLHTAEWNSQVVAIAESSCSIGSQLICRGCSSGGISFGGKGSPIDRSSKRLSLVSVTRPIYIYISRPFNLQQPFRLRNVRG